MSAVVLVLVLLFLQEGRKVQAQAELAAVQTTLGALRMAAVVQDLQAQAAGRSVPTGEVPANPFELLQSRPANYVGVLDAVQALTARPGSWYFEPGCGCVVYLPLEPRWLDVPSGATALRFRVRGGAGPMQLVALEPYLWQGRRVQ